MDIGPLAAGALLARRGFRVLIVGQNTQPNRYNCFDYTFSRQPFLFTSVESPAVRRIVNELSVSQLFQHAAKTMNPAYQVVLRRARLDVFRDPEQTKAELCREFPGDAAAVEEAFNHIGRVNGEIDKLVSNDIVVPPESFIEKREFARAEVQNPFRAESQVVSRLEIDDSSGFGEFLDAPIRFETAGASPLAPFARFRQLGGWLFNCQDVEGGLDGLRSLLVKQIVGQGGDHHPHQRVTEIVVRKRSVKGVLMDGREETTGCQVVLTGQTAFEIAPLVAPNAWTKRFRALVDESPDAVLGYAVNLGVDPEVVPAGLAGTALISLGPGLGDELLRVEQVPQKSENLAAFHVSCVVPPGGEETIQSGALRDAILDRMRWLVPFLDKYLKVIHSPYDGFGPIDLVGESEGDAPKTPYPEEIQKWVLRPPTGEGVLGVENSPHRTGIKGLLMAGAQVVGGLGVEGELIAAWGAARIASKMDPRRERLVRSMRSKVEM